jgi:hypothetical protein
VEGRGINGEGERGRVKNRKHKEWEVEVWGRFFG